MTVCHECDQLQAVPVMNPGDVARCIQCGNELYRCRKNGTDRALAFTFAAAVLFLIANMLPFLGFRVGAQIQETTLMTGIIGLYRQGMWHLATLVLFTTVLVPGFQIFGMGYVLLPIRLNRRFPHHAHVFRWVKTLQPWGMTEVFMLGILVSVVKLAHMATIIPGIAAYAFMALMGALIAASFLADPVAVWGHGSKEELKSPLASPQGRRVVCSICHFFFSVPEKEEHASGVCPRCGAPVHFRKPFSIQKTWALVIAAFIFYIPANLLPITHVVSFGSAQSDTIMSGVIYFLKTGMWPIALVIFVASVLVPLLKLVVLSGLLISVQVGSRRRPKDRAVLYRMTEIVGRWSMLDIFVVTILVALVQLGAVASISAGPAAVYFAAVVVSTMFAAMSFDPRLIWDELETPYDGRKN